MSVRKLHKHFLRVAILSGPLFVEGHVDPIVTPEVAYVQVVITTCNPKEKLTSNTILARSTWFGSHPWFSPWGPARTAPLYLDNAVRSISPSAATGDLWNTMRDSLSSLSRGRCSCMLLKVTPLVFRTISGSFLSHVHFQLVDANQIQYTQLSSPTPSVLGNIASVAQL